MISGLTEITEGSEAVPFQGWIFYDRDCSFCRELALRFENVFAERGFCFEPLQEDWVLRRLNLTREQGLEEMRVLTAGGAVLGGADAVVFLARKIWWMAPLSFFARLPAVYRLLDRWYRWVAAHRSCRITTTATPPLPARTRWLGLVILPLLALTTKPFLPAWGFMWLMAFAIFLGCKWLTLGIATARGERVCPFRATAYLLAWPGMDATRFLSPDLPPRIPRIATLKMAMRGAIGILLGSILLFGVAHHATSPILTGWTGMFGMILILHFGLFALLNAAWRALRVDARPIMEQPLRSTSVAEFWGRRWNGAFNDLALGLVFRPVARRTGVAVVTLVAFAVSGLIHEFVISLPAGAGFGLPTGYFILQGLAILAQRKLAALQGDITGWLFTMIVVAGPAYWLFHPPFVRNVILPFMHAIGAL
jgi:predicted DCC family thiol-disulfide oxidoreductase YuxK